MNTLFISFDYPPLRGGIANLSHEIAKNLSLKDGTLIVVAPKVKGYEEFDHRCRLTTFRITNKKIIREFILFFTVLYLIFKFRIKMLYNLSWYPEAAICYFVNILTGVPYIIHVHGMEYFEYRKGALNKLKYNWLRTFIKRLTFARAKKLIAVSNFTKDRLIARGIDALKIKTVFPGVDCERFRPNLDANEVILRHGLENKKVLLSVARLDDYKGHDMVIRALPGLLLKFPDIRYLIVGTGPNEMHLKKLTDELNLKDRVIFTGIVEDRLLPLYYNACDAFIMLSREILAEAKVEGFGIVFLEAGACAKPIIGGRSGGIEDAVIDGGTGILVDPLNLDEIYGAITKIIGDRHYAMQLGAQGLDRIKKDRLDWKSTAQKIENVLSEAEEKK